MTNPMTKAAMIIISIAALLPSRAIFVWVIANSCVMFNPPSRLAHCSFSSTLPVFPVLSGRQ